MSLFALAFAPDSARAADAEVVTLDPSSQWQLDMGDHKCRIARLFGPEGAPAVFYLEQWDPSDRAAWVVAGKAVEHLRTGRTTSFVFGPSGDHGEFKPRDITLGNFGRSFEGETTVSRREGGDDDRGEKYGPGRQRDWALDPRGLEALDAAGAKDLDLLTLDQGARARITLRLGNLAAPIAAMNACMEDLVKYWGFDPDEQRRVASPPQILNFPSVVRGIQEEYPAAALSGGLQADFHLRLTVGADGSVENCALINQTIAKGFDTNKDPCSIFVRRAKIEPAHDISGNAVRTFYTTRIHYVIN
ncbi:MAG: energy transducer TonB [Erythrobacter sp.]|jgi:hypothetical protein